MKLITQEDFISKVPKVKTDKWEYEYEVFSGDGRELFYDLFGRSLIRRRVNFTSGYRNGDDLTQSLIEDKPHFNSKNFIMTPGGIVQGIIHSISPSTVIAKITDETKELFALDYFVEAKFSLPKTQVNGFGTHSFDQSETNKQVFFWVNPEHLLIIKGPTSSQIVLTTWGNSSRLLYHGE